MNKLLLLTIICSLNTSAQEKINNILIAQEDLSNNIKLEFMAAPKGMIINQNDNSDIHLEALINFNLSSHSNTAMAGAFVPYLEVFALVLNETSGEKLVVNLIPHLNLVEGFHYARNTKLPGPFDDLYTVTLFIEPFTDQVSFHKDWVAVYSEVLVTPVELSYKHINFQALSK